jgi:hypothetical protein
MYSLSFSAFSVEFAVDDEASREATGSLKQSTVAPDTVFVVADSWLCIGNVKHLIASQTETGNLIETLRSLSKRFRNPRSATGLELLIPRGGLCAWLRGYWNRLRRDVPTPADEAGYELLFPLCELTEKGGYLAVYRYDGWPTIETTGQPAPAPHSVVAWSEFETTAASSQVDEMFHALLRRYGDKNRSYENY